jgi:L-ribulokinase
VDFGTQSARAIIVDIKNGDELSSSVCEYRHKVMDKYLIDKNIKLNSGWALQHPRDYTEVLGIIIPKLLKISKVDIEEIIGIGISFTSSTVIPIDSRGVPICFNEKYKDNPHAYAKLWKHHSAQKEADFINEVARKRNEDFIKRYGNRISSEWIIPKILQVYKEAPEIYVKTDRFIEASDWIVMQLTGEEKRNTCAAGYKAFWDKNDGYPSNDFFKELDLDNIISEKLSKNIYNIGTKAGELTKEASMHIGLKEGISVAVGNVDAHASVPTVGIKDEGKMLMIMGTSTCHMLLAKEKKEISGICGVVEDGILPGFMGYEAGQACVGDHFEWFIKNCVPRHYEGEAIERGISIHEYMREKSEKIKPGESGLIALDWWNGNRSILNDSDLSGLILGLNLRTKPEEIYRTLIEATAFGTRMIIENFRDNNILVDELYAAGGIAEKDSLMMQIYSDVTNMKIKIAGTSQAPAYGAAMYASFAAGREKGGYSSIFYAIDNMSKIKDTFYSPNQENVEIYNKLFEEYKILHNYYGRNFNDVMKKLKDIKNNV